MLGVELLHSDDNSTLYRVSHGRWGWTLCLENEGMSLQPPHGRAFEWAGGYGWTHTSHLRDWLDSWACDHLRLDPLSATLLAGEIRDLVADLGEAGEWPAETVEQALLRCGPWSTGR